MVHPYKPEYKCPECETGTMKYRAELFASRYTLGTMYCDNPNCVNSYEQKWAWLKKFTENFNKGGK